MKSLILGTAQWGWNVDRETAFLLLDHWLKAGYSEVDAATNYPINQNPADFRAAENILAEYCRAHGLTSQLNIIAKVGSMDNMRGPEHNLSPSFLYMMADEYRRIFGQNLRGMMVHWDNRDDHEAIEQTLETLYELQEQGIQPGLSGIKYPAVHAAINERLQMGFSIEVKHNVFTSDLARYQPFTEKSIGKHRFLAYGLSAGGLKLGQPPKENSTFDLRGGQRDAFEQRLAQIEALLPDFNLAFVRPPIVTLQQLGMVYALGHAKIGGAIIGPRSVAQLKESIEWHRNADIFDYQDIIKVLSKPF